MSKNQITGTDFVKAALDIAGYQDDLDEIYSASLTGLDAEDKTIQIWTISYHCANTGTDQQADVEVFWDPDFASWSAEFH